LLIKILKTYLRKFWKPIPKKLKTDFGNFENRLNERSERKR